MKNLLLSLGILFLSISAFSQLTQFQDTIYYFSFEYPENWTVTNEKDTNLRVVLISDDGKFELAAYAFFLLEGDVDLEKFVANDSIFFPRLGQTTNTEVDRLIPYIGEYLGYVLDDADHINYIRKKYDRNANGFYAYAHYEVQKHYAYAIIAYSKDSDFEALLPVLESMDVSVPIMKNLKDTFSWKAAKSNMSWEKIKGRLPGLFMWLLYILWLIGMMMSGRYFRKGRDKKKALIKYRDELEEGYVINDNWKKQYKKARRKMIYSIVVCIIILLPSVILFGDKVWIAYLLAPLFFFGGYMGFMIKPAED
ncbi:MAG: TMEM208 family protein [Bacteroidetes bacterium]|nr:TMEM208 family protein [Bacteroidota bacterium]